MAGHEEIILEAIQKKEKKLSKYKLNTGEIQWLLLVIGSSGESSFEIEGELNLNFETEFDRVYILEDFDNKVHRIK